MKGRSEENHYIVAIGASAGGLEAIHEFFDHMPDARNISFVIIQHLSPDHKSLLVELVGRHTNMKVYEAGHNVEIKRSCVYVIPNNKFIKVHSNKLILTEKMPIKVPNNAIDIFMHSLAKEKKKYAIGVILSGTGTDGTRGIATIKQEGGLVLVQDPLTAKFNGMPNSAIASGHVDYVLSPVHMPHQIASYLTETDWTGDKTIDDEMLDRIFEQLRKQAGFDFHLYKTPTITRRVFHRMMKKNYQSPEEYYKFLKSSPEECKDLGKEFLINVTKFFRDVEAFDVVRRQILPVILKEKEPGDQVKMWICACSTGEEVYSLAILLDEVLEENPIPNLTIKIFGTDIDRTNIEIASRGYYPKSIEAEVSPERLKKYFTRQNGGYVIVPRIRKQVVFAAHNVIKDPPFIKNDLVSCRNMLIYMNAPLQQRVYSVLLFALSKGGYLFFGTTENASYIRSSLEEVDSRWKLYRKVTEGKASPYFPDLEERDAHTNGSLVTHQGRRTEKRFAGLWEDLRDTLLGEFNFAAFYIDANLEIREAVGNFDPILKLPKKILKLNLLRMLPAHISTVLVAHIKKAWRDKEQKIIDNLHFDREGRKIALQVVVRPAMPTEGRPFTMIAFHYMQLADDATISPPRLTEIDQNDYVLTLEEELNETKESLQRAIEDLETANEELQSGNEELLSANEELQSSNEELQSLNEELHTLNTEHQLKIRELIELNDDLNNYFRSSNIGQVFLDRNMMIRKFNPESSKMINFIESDIGRPITHISTNIRYTGLIHDIITVLDTGTTIEREVELINGMNFLLRIMPYVTQENRSEGAIISFVDITTITNLNNIIRGVFNSSLSAIFALQAVRDHHRALVDLRIMTTNHEGATMLKREADNLKNVLVRRDLGTSIFDTLFAQLATVVETDKPLHQDIYAEGTRVWFEVTAAKMGDGLVATFTDITQKKNAEERLKKNYVELIATRENLRKLNQELENKVIERTQLLSASEERFQMVARATNDAIWDWDIVNNHMWFSEAFYRKFEFDPAQAFDRRAWVDHLAPEQRETVIKSIEDTINNGGTHWTKEYLFRKANGEHAFILDRGYVIHDEYGMPFRMLGSMLDISELKRAEREVANVIAQRQFVVESMPLIVFTANSKGMVDFVNSQFEVYTGLSQTEALGEGWKAMIHPQDITELNAMWNESVQFRSDVQVELRLRMYNGEFHWNILRAKVRNVEDNGQASWVITMIDIHDQKQQHEILEKMVEERTQELTRINLELESSNSDLQQFASVASHDLQEPLRKIHLYANLIHDRHGAHLDGAAPYLTKILQSSGRMKSIINNILGYSKLSAENATFEPVDFNELIAEIVEDLEVAITEKKAVINAERFPRIECIPAQMRQVFQNILGNALKFSKPDLPPVIDISCERITDLSFDASTDENGDFCRITVTDNGIGFNEKFSTNIFLLFQRLHSKDTYEGTGIGLAIAKKIIEKHLGLISAHGKENNGATFIIVLPLKQHQHVAEE